MPTLTTATIGVSGGDYTSVVSWEAGEQKNLVAVDEQHTATISGSWSGSYENVGTVGATIGGWTTDSTRYVRLQAENISRVTMPLNDDSYQIKGEDEGVEDDGFTRTLIINQDFTEIFGIYVYHYNDQFSYVGGIKTRGIQVNANNVLIDSCFVYHVYDNVVGHGTNSSNMRGINVENTAYSARIINCVVVWEQLQGGLYQDIYGIVCSTSGSVIYNNFVYHNGGVVGNDGNNVLYNTSEANGARIINNIGWATDETAFTFAVFFSTGSYNASSDNSATGPNSRNNQTFTFVDPSRNVFDFNLSGSDVGALGFGLDLSSDPVYPITTDFNGDTRYAPWDIGPTQFNITPPPPPPASRFRLSNATIKTSTSNIRIY